MTHIQIYKDSDKPNTIRKVSNTSWKKNKKLGSVYKCIDVPIYIKAMRPITSELVDPEGFQPRDPPETDSPLQLGTNLSMV